ncbi:non-hydrolyzing UDP-N-acetylglucosamine 2-epimerase [Candidatus Zixiibacteriota bacterium]
MKIASIVGARPQFIKCAPLSRLIRKEHREVLIHTGQHYDRELSQIFFDQLEIPKPDYNLGVGSGPHGEQTAEMLWRVEEVLLKEKPQAVVVYGDTNSTLAGSLSAAKLWIPVVHVEAGLRSFNRRMPEEINRILTDRLSALLFCPTETAVENLNREGITQGVHNTGDVMYDALLQNGRKAEEVSSILRDLRLEPQGYYLITVHRAENTDHPENLTRILTAMDGLDLPAILPIHPRTRKILEEMNVNIASQDTNLRFVDPVSYLDMLVLEKKARKILTDSGGVQKEAWFFGVPCITLRAETEWVETLEGGWNTLVGTDSESIARAIRQSKPPAPRPKVFGDGQAAEKMVHLLDQK